MKYEDIFEVGLDTRGYADEDFDSIAALKAENARLKGVSVEKDVVIMQMNNTIAGLRMQLAESQSDAYKANAL